MSEEAAAAAQQGTAASEEAAKEETAGPPDVAHNCLHCGKAEADKRCSRCHTANYCSRDCQVASWPTHKQSCKKPPGSEWTITVTGPFRMGKQKIKVKPKDDGQTLLVRYVRAMLADPNDPNRRVLDLTNGSPHLAPRGPDKRGFLDPLDAPLEQLGVIDGDAMEVVIVPVPGGGERGVAMTEEECVRRNTEWLEGKEHIK